MGRNLRPWWIALIVSLLLHGLLFSSTQWSLPQWVAPPEPTPFDVELVPVPVPLPVVKALPPPLKSQPKGVAKRAIVAEPAMPEPVTSVAEVSPSPVEPVVTEPAVVESAAAKELLVPEAAPPPQVAAPPAAPPVVTEPPPPSLNALPARIDMRFKVTYGIASGEQTLVWVNESGKHYTVISVAEATGLAGLFYRGKFVQTSHGRITPNGLQPEEFWDQRGDKRSRAQFDSEQGHLTLNPDKGAPRHFSYSGEVQDVLSLFFQLALTAPPSTGELRYNVFNGKKLRDYRYEVRGVTQLETAVGPLRTLHISRVGDSDGRFEVWLAVDRHYLPVRVLKSDEKNNEIELTLVSMTPE